MAREKQYNKTPVDKISQFSFYIESKEAISSSFFLVYDCFVFLYCVIVLRLDVKKWRRRIDEQPSTQ